jgi:hypothetical protein
VRAFVSNASAYDARTGVSSCSRREADRTLRDYLAEHTEMGGWVVAPDLTQSNKNVMRSRRRRRAMRRFSPKSCGHRACLCPDRACSSLPYPRGTNNGADGDLRGAHPCARRGRSRCDHAGAESMPPSRQRRSIASPDASDFNETSGGPSDAPHMRRQATRESRGALCHKFHSHPPLAVGATKKSAAPICWK